MCVRPQRDFDCLKGHILPKCEYVVDCDKLREEVEPVEEKTEY